MYLTCPVPTQDAYHAFITFYTHTCSQAVSYTSAQVAHGGTSSTDMSDFFVFGVWVF